MSSESPDRLPPFSREAERSVLGSMLRDNAVIGDVLQILDRNGDNFYADAHQKIYRVILDLYDRGHPVDLVVLADMLKDQKQLEDVGGYGYIGELWDVAPTAANAEYYARIVRDKAIVRNLIHASTEILRDSYDQRMPADQLLEGAERAIMDIAQRGLTGQTMTLEQALREAYDRIDARHQSEQTAISGIPTGFIDLDNLTAGLQNRELIIVAARPSVGKCLVHDSEIVLADGSVATIEEIFKRREGRLLTLGDDWRFRLTEPSAFVDDGIKPVFRVRTRLGREVEATASHPFRTLEGWRPLAELQPGDRIAVPRRIDVFGSVPMRECEVKLLAYFIGDGGLTDCTPEFTNGNPRIQADFVEAIAEFGAVKVRIENENGPRTTSFSIGGDPHFIAKHRCAFGERLQEAMTAGYWTDARLGTAVGVSQSLVGYWRKGVCVPNSQVFEKLSAVLELEPDALVPSGLPSISRSSKNPLTHWLVEAGLWGKNALEKTIPASVFRLPRHQLALFLNRLFATDGWASVAQDGASQVGYGSSSEKLARQVQHLLLRFGVVSSFRMRGVRYKGARRTSWQLEITGREDLRRFHSEIGVFAKEEALDRVLATVERRKEKPTRDTIPIAVWQLLAMAKGAESWATLARRAGLTGGHTNDHTNIHVGKRCPSRARLFKLAEALDDQPLRELATSEVYWDEIVAVEPAGMKQVYDLTIPDTHNFVANDVCVHNTAFSLGIIRNILVNEGLPVFFVSLEQSRIEIAERLLCSQAKVNSHNLRKGQLSADEMGKLIEAGGVLQQTKLFIDDSPAQGMLRIAANARRLKLRQDIRMVVIDYLQLIEPENRRDPRQEQVAQISRRLKFLARELEIPVVALAQVNRASEDRQDHRPRLADLRESGSIEQDADTVLILHRPEMHEPGQHDGIIEVIVAKQRNGPTGEVTLTYLKQYLRYENHAHGVPFQQ